MPVAEAAGFAAGAFLVAVPLIPLIVLITVLFAGAFFAGTDFLTTIVPVLASLESLIVLALPLPVGGTATG